MNPQEKEDQSERVGGGARGFEYKRATASPKQVGMRERARARERTSGGGRKRDREERHCQPSPKQIRERERANERVRKRTRLVETRDL